LSIRGTASGISNDPDDLLNVREDRVDPDDNSAAGRFSPHGSEVDTRVDGWPGARPILVEVASLLFATVGFLKILTATLVFTAYGPDSLGVALPLGLLVAGAIVAAGGSRAGGSRSAALTVALVALAHCRRRLASACWASSSA
jgi:hypothetical protein